MPALDQDFYNFNAAAGNTIAVDVDAAVKGSALDSFVEVQNAAGEILCANDDGSSRDAYLSCTAPVAGTYYAVVRSYAARATAATPAPFGEAVHRYWFE